MTEYAITLTKVVPGEPFGQLSDLLEDWAFKDEKAAEKHFDSVALSPVYIRKELWAKDTESQIRRLLKEERYADRS